MNSRKLITYFNYLASIVFLICIVVYFQRHQDEVQNILKFSQRALGELFLMSLLIIVIYSYKILLTYRFLGLRISNFSWFRIFIISRFINFHVLQGANVYRSFILKKEHNFSYTRSVSLIGGLVWLELVMIFMFTLAVIILPQFYKEHIAAIEILGGLLIVVVALPWVLLQILKLASLRSLVRASWISKLKEILDDLTRLIANRQLLGKYFLASTVIFVLYFLSVRICFQALETPFEEGALALFTAFLFLTRTLNIVPGNIGLAEIGCGLFVNQLGGSVGGGIVVSGVFRILGYGATVFWALFCLKDLWRYGKLKREKFST